MLNKDDFPAYDFGEEDEDDEFSSLIRINGILPDGCYIEQTDNNKYLCIHDNQVLFRLNRRALIMFELTLHESEHFFGEEWKHL